MRGPNVSCPHRTQCGANRPQTLARTAHTTRPTNTVRTVVCLPIPAWWRPLGLARVPMRYPMASLDAIPSNARASSGRKTYAIFSSYLVVLSDLRQDAVRATEPTECARHEASDSCTSKPGPPPAIEQSGNPALRVPPTIFGKATISCNSASQSLRKLVTCLCRCPLC